MTNKPMLSVEREPVAWAVEISGCLKFFEQKKSAENARRRYEKVMDAERVEPFPLFTDKTELVEFPDVDQLAQIIRKVDGSHALGAGALAEAIHEEVSILNKMARSKADLDAGRTVSSDQMRKNLQAKFLGDKS